MFAAFNRHSGRPVFVSCCCLSAERGRDEMQQSTVECIFGDEAELNQRIRPHQSHVLPASIPPFAPAMSGARSLRFPAEYSVFVRSLVLP